jgi:hypothetical protein
MRTAVVASLIAMAAWALPAAARAEHTGGRSSADLSFDLELEGDGFRLGGRFIGGGGEWGAWLSGHRRPGGVSLEGILEHPDGSHRFDFEADLPGWLFRSVPPRRAHDGDVI